MRKNFIMLLIAVAIFVLEIFYISTRLDEKLSSIDLRQHKATTSIKFLDKSISRIEQRSSMLKDHSNYHYIFLTSGPLKTTSILAKR